MYTIQTMMIQIERSLIIFYRHSLISQKFWLMKILLRKVLLNVKRVFSSLNEVLPHLFDNVKLLETSSSEELFRILSRIKEKDRLN